MFYYIISALAPMGDASQVEGKLDIFGTSLKQLYTAIWPWLLGVGVLVGGFWAIVLGIKIVKANTAEKKSEAKMLILQLFIGIIAIFALILLLPMLFEALAAWAGTSVKPLK